MRATSGAGFILSLLLLTLRREIAGHLEERGWEQRGY
jgi:hypothetical protein